VCEASNEAWSGCSKQVRYQHPYKLTFLSLKLTFLSLKLTFLSYKLTFLSYKLTFLSLHTPDRYCINTRTIITVCFVCIWSV
jgi:hypothetical protein